MHPDLLPFLTDTLTHEAWTGQDSYGKPTFAAPVPHAARVEYVVRRFTTAAGQEKVSRAIAYLAWPAGLRFGLRDRYTLSDGEQPEVQRVDHHTDETGAQDHVSVFF